MIAFNVPFVAGDEEKYIADAFARRSFSGNGPFAKRCQELIGKRLGGPDVLLTTSCTAALELTALALDIGPGDEVIVPSFTFVATASAYLRAGARIVFAEIDPDTMTLDPDDVERRITSRTRAVVPIHYAGVAFDVVRMSEICAKSGAALIEDAAQGLDCEVGGRPLGTFGRFAAFSFHETKNIHCGLGGALVVNDGADFERTQEMWERGTNRAKMFRGLVDKYSWVEPGSSFYPTELQAAFLLAQLEALDRNSAVRVARFEHYRARLRAGEERGWYRLQRVDPAARVNGHCVFVRTHTPAASEALRLALLASGVQAHIHYVPLHSSPMGLRMGYRPSDLPLTERAAGCVLRMPMHASLSEADVDFVCDQVEAAGWAGVFDRAD